MGNSALQKPPRDGIVRALKGDHWPWFFSEFKTLYGVRTVHA